jgi:hypothetical protein
MASVRWRSVEESSGPSRRWRAVAVAVALRRPAVLHRAEQRDPRAHLLATPFVVVWCRNAAGSWSPVLRRLFLSERRLGPIVPHFWIQDWPGEHGMRGRGAMRHYSTRSFTFLLARPDVFLNGTSIHQYFYFTTRCMRREKKGKKAGKKLCGRRNILHMLTFVFYPTRLIIGTHYHTCHVLTYSHRQ